MIVKFENDRINFIDENDHYFGCDMTQQCCEDSGWAVRFGCETSDIELGGNNDDGIFDEVTLSGYFFPNDFLVGVLINDDPDDSYRENSVCVKAIHPDPEKPDAFITIFNEHEGCYYHAWDFKHNDVLLHDGEI